MFPPIGLYSSTLRWVALAFLATLAACTSAPPPKPAGHMMREQSRWVPVTWNELPGWHADSVQAAWPALVSSCQRPAQAWTRVCSTLQHDPPRNNAQARSWLMKNLQPYRVESLDGATQGLITGYYEPLVEARRKPAGTFRVALYEPPADLVTRRPYWTRQADRHHRPAREQATATAGAGAGHGQCDRRSGACRLFLGLGWQRCRAGRAHAPAAAHVGALAPADVV